MADKGILSLCQHHPGTTELLCPHNNGCCWLGSVACGHLPWGALDMGSMQSGPQLGQAGAVLILCSQKLRLTQGESAQGQAAWECWSVHFSPRSVP